MACVLDSIFHTTHIHSSICHSTQNIYDTAMPMRLRQCNICIITLNFMHTVYGYEPKIKSLEAVAIIYNSKYTGIALAIALCRYTQAMYVL